MKWLLIGDSNVSNNAKVFVTKDHSLRNERKVVKCTTFTNFKLQVRPFTILRYNVILALTAY